MNVTVVWATIEVQDVVPVAIECDATVAEAVAQSGLALHYGLDLGVLRYAIFGRKVDAHTRLDEGDRVELTRPLPDDPKVARARRARENALAKRNRSQQTPNLG